jgi:hypothetical protein
MEVTSEWRVKEGDVRPAGLALLLLQMRHQVIRDAGEGGDPQLALCSSMKA